MSWNLREKVMWSLNFAMAVAATPSPRQVQPMAFPGFDHLK